MSTIHAVTPSSTTDRRRYVREPWVRRHPVAAYFAVTYAVSWSYWSIALGALGHDSIWWVVPGVFGPAVAAVTVLSLVEGRAGLHQLRRSLLRWRVGLRWYVIGLVVLPALVVLSYLFLPGGPDRIREDGWLVVPTYLAYAAVVTVVGGGQEEIGWRGFALPRMQERLGPLRAALLLGVLWGVWHTPLFVFIPDYDNSGYGAAGVTAMYALFVSTYALGLSVLFAWLYNNVRGSVLFLMLVHGFSNAAWAFGPPTRAHSAAFYVLSAVLAIAVAIATRGRLAYGRPA